MTTCQMCSKQPATQVVWQRDENWTAKVCESCAREAGFVRLEKESRELNRQPPELDSIRKRVADGYERASGSNPSMAAILMLADIHYLLSLPGIPK